MDEEEGEEEVELEIRTSERQTSAHKRWRQIVRGRKQDGEIK